MTNEITAGPRVSVHFTKSSSKDGGCGYSITVNEDASREEADAVYDLAAHLRQRAEDELSGKLMRDLERSVAAIGYTDKF